MGLSSTASPESRLKEREDRSWTDGSMLHDTAVAAGFDEGVDVDTADGIVDECEPE